MGDQEYGVSNGDEQYQQQETYEEQGQQQIEAGSGDGPLNPGDKINASKNDDDERWASQFAGRASEARGLGYACDVNLPCMLTSSLWQA